MTCTRCWSPTGEDHVRDFWGSSYGQRWATSRQCVKCGRVYHSVIEQNSLARQEKVLVLSCGEQDYQDDEAHPGSESFMRLAA